MPVDGERKPFGLLYTLEGPRYVELINRVWDAERQCWVDEGSISAEQVDQRSGGPQVQE